MRDRPQGGRSVSRIEGPDRNPSSLKVVPPLFALRKHHRPLANRSAGWWGRQDSNLRSHEAADLQSAPFATRDTPPPVPPAERLWQAKPGPEAAASPRAGLQRGAVMGDAAP